LGLGVVKNAFFVGLIAMEGFLIVVQDFFVVTATVGRILVVGLIEVMLCFVVVFLTTGLVDEPDAIMRICFVKSIDLSHYKFNQHHSKVHIN